MNNVVAFRRSPKLEQPEDLSVIVVAGSGAAGATTTCFGLATALRLGTGVQVAAIDGTFGGGNLLDRVGVEPIDPARAIRRLGSRMAVSSAGVVVVGHGESSDSVLVDSLLADRHLARIHDVGTALRSRRLTPLLEAGAAIVIVAPARSEPLARMRAGLDWLLGTYGRGVLARTVVSISHQLPHRLVDLAPIREHLAPRVAGFVEVPFDASVARPGTVDHRCLSVASIDAWTDVLDALGRIEAGHRDTDHQAGAGEPA
ncbi:hypothetical protein D092_20785 [Rhodococcus ruber Chol-4]|uniref:MinD-like ATPase involved in chromosome partitioning or flagellar assembly n=1 Tax=Rhodococcus artemisiae TaxID=714159 RepID=A0ABU7LKN2_9NOCA|nr:MULTISPECIES: hypothetical protein [Rhodococcus]KXF84359.1 hypothetical protein D092_20785 [Rhodococcus ruber Chol-4]MEE2062128.1 hypothetical protein [Rhodococcus artemisiae]